MDGIDIDRKRQTSEWGVAIIAVAVFLAIVFCASFFGSADVANLATSQG